MPDRPAAAASTAVCPDCGLSARELRDGGLMGCPACYGALTGLVEEAARELHGVPTAGGRSPQPRPAPAEIEAASAPEGAVAPEPADRSLPWPTRRGTARPRHPEP